MKVCPVCGRPGSAAEVRCPHDGAGLVALDGGGPARAEELLGQVIDGRYRIESIVGRGGMGTVYAARHVVVGRPVALKVLRPGLEHREEALARFVREAQAANAVRSRAILRADDFGQLAGGGLYVVMELLEGRSLGAALRDRLLDRAQLLHVFVQLADGLAAAHAAGVIHRDLKPDNVFLIDDPAEPLGVRILDFGVAKLVDRDAGLTSTGVILGTPHYMAPEQARGQPVDHRADVYALGVVMYQAFTGRLPFVADSAVGVLTAAAIDEPSPPSHSGVDAHLEGVILRCMRKAPDERFASMGEVSGALRSLAGGRVLPPAPSPAAPPPTTRITGPATGASIPVLMAGAGPDTTPGMTAHAPPPPSRGLYLAIGAGVATVGVVAALLVAGPRGLLGGRGEGAPASPPPAGTTTEVVPTSPDPPASPSPAASTASPVPSAPGPAAPSAPRSAAPSAPGGSATRPVPATTGGAAAPRPPASSPPRPPRPRPGEIRSPFD